MDVVVGIVMLGPPEVVPLAPLLVLPDEAGGEG